MERKDAVMPWLTASPDSDTGAGELKTIFSRQFMRWWDFRKSQWNNRGLGDSKDGLSAFVEASRRRYESSGAEMMASSPSFSETIERQWHQLPESRRQRPPPEGQTFAAYREAVKIRLAPHHFTLPLQLRRDPQKQTGWTDWLEYLNFESRCMEDWIALAESLEPRYQECVRRLRKATQPQAKIVTIDSAALSSTHARTHNSPAKRVNMGKELTAARADRDASQQSIDIFLRETNTYTQARANASHQRRRVDWIVQEGRMMENDICVQRATAKSKKRKRSNEEHRGYQFKRTRGHAMATAVPQPLSTAVRRSARHHAGVKS